MSHQYKQEDIFFLFLNKFSLFFGTSPHSSFIFKSLLQLIAFHSTSLILLTSFHFLTNFRSYFFLLFSLVSGLAHANPLNVLLNSVCLYLTWRLPCVVEANVVISFRSTLYLPPHDSYNDSCSPLYFALCSFQYLSSCF